MKGQEVYDAVKTLLEKLQPALTPTLTFKESRNAVEAMQNFVSAKEEEMNQLKILLTDFISKYSTYLEVVKANSEKERVVLDLLEQKLRRY